MTAPRGAARREGGFTLVEVVVGLVILTIGVLGLAGTTLWVMRQTTLGEISTERTAALQSVVERLRAVDYDSVSAGSHTEGPYTVGWTVTTDSRSKLVELITTGPGLGRGASGPPSIRSSVADTFTYRIYKR